MPAKSKRPLAFAALSLTPKGRLKMKSFGKKPMPMKAAKGAKPMKVRKDARKRGKRPMFM